MAKTMASGRTGLTIRSLIVAIGIAAAVCLPAGGAAAATEVCDYPVTNCVSSIAFEPGTVENAKDVNVTIVVTMSTCPFVQHVYGSLACLPSAG
jgi:hypothetical protein